jgi:hypothetical protein
MNNKFVRVHLMDGTPIYLSVPHIQSISRAMQGMPITWVYLQGHRHGHAVSETPEEVLELIRMENYGC